ncbi:MAG: hypothetical protein ABSE51_17000 [Terracidiphilus sp.]|jgi:hypothetical protein
MNTHDQDHKQALMKKLLQEALPPVGGDTELEHDLWPAMLMRLDAQPTATVSSGWTWLNGAWFDRALAAGLVVLAVLFPASIPVLLYYL